MPGPNPSILTMRSGQNAVAVGGSSHGWVSGDPANIAASASVLVKFDLGPNWDQYPRVQLLAVGAGPSSGLNVSVGSAMLADFSDSLPVNSAEATNVGIINGAVDNVGKSLHFRPMGRYVQVSVSNADGVNAVGATARVQLAMYPGA